MNDDRDTAEVLAMLRTLMAQSPFIVWQGVEITSIDLDSQRLVMRQPARPEFEGTAGTGVWHGGALASLIDTAGCFAVIMVAGHDAGTIDFRTDYLRPAKGDHVDAIATVRRIGRTSGVADVDVIGADGKPVAIGRGNFFVSGQ